MSPYINNTEDQFYEIVAEAIKESEDIVEATARCLPYRNMVPYYSTDGVIDLIRDFWNDFWSKYQ